jgi:hypothetical protein
MQRTNHILAAVVEWEAISEREKAALAAAEARDVVRRMRAASGAGDAIGGQCRRVPVSYQRSIVEVRRIFFCNSSTP